MDDGPRRGGPTPSAGRAPTPDSAAEAEHEAEQSDGYVESDDDGGSSIEEEPDSPNAESAADLQRLLEAHEAPFGHGVSAAVETVLRGRRARPPGGNCAETSRPSL